MEEEGEEEEGLSGWWGGMGWSLVVRMVGHRVHSSQWRC